MSVNRCGFRGRAAHRVAALAFLLPLSAPLAAQQNSEPIANWALAKKFDNDAMRGAIFSTSVNAEFINETDSAWYNWRDRNGARFMLVVPKTKTRQLMFDHVRFASELSELHRKAFEPNALPFTTIEFADSTNSHTFRFVVDTIQYEYDMRTAAMKSLGRAPRGRAAAGGRGGRGGRGGGGGGGGGGGQRDFRNYAPDSTIFAFARDHNLYVVTVATGDTVQLTTDGVEYYGFGARDTTSNDDDDDEDGDENDDEGDDDQGGDPNDPRVRANVTWAPDSRAFHVTRSDSRDVKDLYLINMLAEPRPELVKYRYPMPGEANVRTQELHVYTRDDGRISKVSSLDKWRDQSLSDIHWPTDSKRLRLLRRDRLRQNVELVELDMASRVPRVLLEESVIGATLEWSPVGITPRVQYIKGGGDFLWWSERTGWGHFYLYDHDGNLKSSVTSGPWRAETVQEVDSVRNVVWISGVGREPDEVVYHQHLYRANLDGSALTLLNPGNAYHNSELSPSRKYVIDNYSRPDLAPKAVVRDAGGEVVLELEEMDLTRLAEMGWRMPETFVVKAADGFTDIYGNMWKPFDFDPNRKYPIIANVYPGPQTESVSTSFSANPSVQRLAQLGFIVIQIGNRGGSPRRSNAYQAFSYQNLRDYGLADKKAGIEQLAARHSFIDIERVGLYGHSGGGFMTGAAMLVPPYNDFFKVGVASSGNHDNNVYGDYWAEQNHGLREVRVRRDSIVASNGGANGNGNGNGNGSAGEAQYETRFEIDVPANHELAENLKGKLLLVHGDMDNNVHPAGTIRLVEALIKANKRFDLMIMPGKAHGFGDMQEYFQNMMFEYFAEHLLGDYYRADADMQ
ncbi:MAG: DPP IV N-terminal domain-containing protein [Gemmatimonadota bacterium]